jgi:hypothetical protein
VAADEIIAELEELNAHQTTPGLAAVAIELARAFDGTDAPTSRAVVARELAALMKTVRALAPVKAEGDKLDDLSARRAKRRGA